MRINLLIVFILCVNIYSCKKDTENIVSTVSPVESQFKFSCKINGVYWGTDSTENGFFLDTVSDTRQLICVGFDSLNIISVSWISPGSHTLELPLVTSAIPSPAMILYEGYKNGVLLDNYFPISGNVQYTAYDSSAKTVSGIFESTLVDPSVNDTVIITNGKFSNLNFLVNFL